MYRFFIVCIIAISTTFSLEASDRNNIEHTLTHVRDSLVQQLSTQTDKAKRLELLLNLGDVTLTLNDDYTYVEQMWHEAIEAGDDELIIGAGKSLMLRWNNRGTLDSADVWLNRCRKYFKGRTAEGNLAYLSMMREIRDIDNMDELADQLIAERNELHSNSSPYKKMRLMFLLGVLASKETLANKQVMCRTSREYFEEGLAIARSLPVDEAFSFYQQFLVALGSESPEYAEEMITFKERYRLRPNAYRRPFASKRPDIMAYARMLNHGDKIGRAKMDKYFGLFNELTSKYPYECPLPYDFYYNKEAAKYYRYIKDWRHALQCCDTAMQHAAECNMPSWQFLEQKYEYQIALGEYQDACATMQRRMEVADSLAAVDASTKLMELQTQYDVDKITFQKRTAQQRLLYSVAVCLLLLLITLIIVGYNRILLRKNRELVRRIRENEQIEQVIENDKLHSADTNSAEYQLFVRIQELFADKSILVSDITRDNIALMLNTNATYITDAIRDHADGANFSTYLNRQRVKYARILLEQEHNMSIDDIAAKSGFCSRSRFHSSFKEYYNITPGEFRRAL